MFARILVPLDGSRFAEVATPVAVRLARDTGARLRFLLVHETRLSAVPLPEGAIVTADDQTAIRDAEGRYLEDVLGRLETPIVKASADVVDGTAGSTLAEEIVSWKADLVVMATHGRGPVTRFWLGSVTDYLVRHVSTPMLLLRPRDEADWPAADLHLKKILVPLDLSPASEAVLEPAIALATLHGATLELANVVEPVVGIPPSPFPFPVGAMTEVDQQHRQEGERGLAAVAERIAARGVSTSYTLLAGSSVASAVLEHAESTHADLVALAAHGRGGLRRALLGSVADKILRGTGVPVLIVRPN
jgi:nucleotide-binding universal stress UspA family protein